MDCPIYLRPSGENLRIDLYVVPRASRSRIVGEFDGRLKVQITAPPVDGAANKEIVSLFSSLFRIPKSRFQIIHGQTGKRKTIEITDVSLTEIVPNLSRAL